MIQTSRINAVLLSPINHTICELLGIEKNCYGVVPKTMDVLAELIYYLKEGESSDSEDANLDQKRTNLLCYLQNKGLIDNLVNCEDIVDQTLVNNLTYTFFDFKYDKVDSKIFDKFNIPIDLITTDPKSLKKCFGKLQVMQKKDVSIDDIQNVIWGSPPTSSRSLDNHIQLVIH